jgi:cytochrome P450
MPEYTPPSLLKLINPARPLLMWNYNRIIRNYLLPIIHRNVAAQAQRDTTGTETKTVLSLATKSYLAEKAQEAKPTPTIQVDKDFVAMTVPQLVVFLFAGHDTTAVTLCFAYHLLSQRPSTLARLRAEHDAVFGPDPSAAAARLTANPILLNALPYTTAVLKETLRLFTPAATARQGQPDFHLVHPTTRKRYPTADVVVLQSSCTTHHLESVFPRANEFLPERFLASEGEELYVKKNSFRPFELGPRGCIGQELAMVELKMILVMTVREFEVESAYDKEAMPVVMGQGTYQVGNVTGHPKGGMPVRVRLRA